MKVPRRTLQALWRRHGRELRDPARIASHWPLAAPVDPRLLQVEADAGWSRVLRRLDVTLLVTREYEHLAIAISPAAGKPALSWFPVPHPSGIAVDRRRRRIHLASTRNPNVLLEFAPVSGFLPREDLPPPVKSAGVLVPTRSRFLPGCSYLHDLALIGDGLYGASTGRNAIVRLDGDAGLKPAWWPRSIDARSGPLTSRNHLQLNSIAAGRTLKTSFFSASSAEVGSSRPGDLDYAVDGQGVVFSGATRRPVARGLTRPHSIRLHRGGLWVDNSGYGEMGRVHHGRFDPLVRLPGWTRGLCLIGDVAFVGTSHVIPGYERYAPGVDAAKSVCGIHAVDLASGRRLGSLVWPYGHQIFAIDWIPRRWSAGFPFSGSGRPSPSEERRLRSLFYSFTVRPT